MPVNNREIVLDTLLAMEKEKERSHGLMKEVLDKYDYLEGKEKAFIKRVTEGTIERRLELDYLINRFSNIPVKKMKPLIRNLLRMCVYQLLYMDGVPDSAVINEGVKLAGKRSFTNLKGFVNAVLRNMVRQKEKLPYPDPQKEPLLYLSVKYSMPEWIVKMWQDAYGNEIAEKLLEEMLHIKQVSIRFVLSLSKEQVHGYIRQMEEIGVEVCPSPYLSYAYLLTGVEGVQALPGYLEGAFLVQDVSSMLCVEGAGIRPGHRVMDVCAAPGGKSILACEKGGNVLSGDISEFKLSKIEENRKRLKTKGLTIRIWDASTFDPNKKESADVVFLDVPCSGLGVIGKKRDIKYHASEEKLKSLLELQKEIIKGSWQYVKPGGVLIYSTCTICREENEEMYRWILKEFPFQADSLEEFLPKELWEQKRSLGEKTGYFGLSKEEWEGCIQFLPGYMKADGFFLARMKRT